MTFVEFITMIAPLVYFIGGTLFILCGCRAVGGATYRLLFKENKRGG